MYWNWRGVAHFTAGWRHTAGIVVITAQHQPTRPLQAIWQLCNCRIHRHAAMILVHPEPSFCIGIFIEFIFSFCYLWKLVFLTSLPSHLSPVSYSINASIIFAKMKKKCHLKQGGEYSRKSFRPGVSGEVKCLEIWMHRKKRVVPYRF